MSQDNNEVMTTEKLRSILTDDKLTAIIGNEIKDRRVKIYSTDENGDWIVQDSEHTYAYQIEKIEIVDYEDKDYEKSFDDLDLNDHQHHDDICDALLTRNNTVYTHGNIIGDRKVRMIAENLGYSFDVDITAGNMTAL
jgi:hypothetical protein